MVTNIVRYSGEFLMIGGAAFFFFSLSAVLKFFLESLKFLIALIYILALISLSASLFVSCISYCYYGRRFSNTWGYIAAITAVLVALGYSLLAIAIMGGLGENMVFTFGLAVTFSRVGLFFYGFSGIAFYFERYEGYWGGIGSILILLFGASYHFFAFISRAWSVTLGAIMTMLASLGFIMQGFSMRLMGRKYEFRKPKFNVKII